MLFRSSNGTELSAIGMQASSAISRVITSSKGCISPIWLLPISRIIRSRVKNIIAVLINISAITVVLAIIIKVYGFKRFAFCSNRVIILAIRLRCKPSGLLQWRGLDSPRTKRRIACGSRTRPYTLKIKGRLGRCPFVIWGYNRRYKRGG